MSPGNPMLLPPYGDRLVPCQELHALTDVLCDKGYLLCLLVCSSHTTEMFYVVSFCSALGTGVWLDSRGRQPCFLVLVTYITGWVNPLAGRQSS